MAVATDRGYALGVNTGIATTDVAIPSAVNVGDWMAVQFVTSAGSITMSTPTGWTLLAYSGVVNTRSMYLFGKRKASGDPSTVTFTASAASAITWSLVYGSGGVVDPASWIKRTYIPAGNTAARGYDIRRTYYEEQVAAGSPNGFNRTTRLRGMAVPANSLVLSAFGEATGTSETESEITSTGATRWFFAPHQGSNINTHWWAKEFVTTAKTTADILVTYPQVQSDNGAAVQIAIPELVEEVPVVILDTSFESGSPFTVVGSIGATGQGFEPAATSARTGARGRRRTSSTATHAQAVTPEVYTPSGAGYRFTGYVRIDSTATPMLAGITVGAAADGTGGIQLVIDTRNGPAAQTGTAGIQLRGGMSTPILADAVPTSPIASAAWYRLEMDWFPSSASIRGRVYEDATGTLIGKVEGGSPAASGGVGMYSYGAASFDDFRLERIVAPTKAPLRIANGDGTTRVIQALYWDGGREVGISRFEMVQRGLTVPELMALERIGKMAHRGSSNEYQEHTARGYMQSAIAGVDVMEMSLQITSDDVLILAHDPTANRTSSSVGPSAANGGTDWRFDQHTWAEVSQLVQDLPNRGDTRFTTDRYYRYDELAPKWIESHIVLTDSKNISAAKLPLVINYIKTLPNYQNRVMGKYFHTGLSIGRAFANEGMRTWGFAYENDVFQTVNGTVTKTPRLDTDTGSLQYNHRRPAENGLPAFEWDFLGMEWSASQEAWTEVLRLAGSRKVIGHIVASVAQADLAVGKGAKVLQISGVNAVTTKY